MPSETARVVLGLDLALRRSGYALIDGSADPPAIYAAGIVICPGEEAEALARPRRQLAALIDRAAPDLVAIESPGGLARARSRSARTARLLDEALGVTLACCGEAGVASLVIGQERVKRLLTGSPRASKDLVERAVRGRMAAGLLSPLPAGCEPAPADVIDAVAIALAAFADIAARVAATEGGS